jgi:peptide/nickel transport system ATP-binding protein
MTEPVLSVRDLRVAYGSVLAVDGVSFDVAPGEVLGLAGESGCGKSTLAQAVLRILRPPAVITGGAVLVGERDVLSLGRQEIEKLRWREASLVFQSAMNALNPVMTVGAQIADVLVAHGRDVKTSREEPASLLELVGLDASHLQAYPHELSGGMRQRVVIAMALALEPSLVLMDEPTTALDVVVQREILLRIDELRKRLGFAVVFITHDLPLLLEIADRIAVLYAGQIVEIGPARSLLEDPKHPYAKGLVESFPSIADERVRIEGIGGTPPDLRRLPTGCRFHPRCPRVMGRCKTEMPEAQEVSSGRAVACHLYDAAAR